MSGYPTPTGMDLHETPMEPTRLRQMPTLTPEMSTEEKAAALEAAGYAGLAQAMQQSDVTAEAEPSETDRDRAYLQRLAFPEQTIEAAWEQLPQEWRGALRAYLANLARYVAGGVGVYLGGGTGRGKTCALALIARAARRAEIECEYAASADDLLWACKLTDDRAAARAKDYRGLGEELDLQKRWPFTKTPLLLLDDLDAVPGVGYDPERDAWDRIARFLYARDRTGLATCIASNLPFVTVQETVGITDKPGMARVKSRWQVRIPEGLRLVTRREDQRGKQRESDTGGAQ